MRKLHVLYITGLGDTGRNLTAQWRLIRVWRCWGVNAELVQMNWGDKGPWPPKLAIITDRIDALAAQGKPVALVGVSAGASAAINAYAARASKVAGVVCIVGKVNRPDKIARYHHSRNPALIPSVVSSDAAVKAFKPAELSAIMSRYAMFDEYVRRPDSYIPGASNRVVVGVTHAFTIAEQLVFGAPLFLRFLKKQAKIK